MSKREIFSWYKLNFMNTCLRQAGRGTKFTVREYNKSRTSIEVAILVKDKMDCHQITKRLLSTAKGCQLHISYIKFSPFPYFLVAILV